MLHASPGIGDSCVYLQLRSLLEIAQTQIEHLERRIDTCTASPTKNMAATPMMRVSSAEASYSRSPTARAPPVASFPQGQLQHRVSCLEGDAAALRSLPEDDLIRLIEVLNHSTQEAQSTCVVCIPSANTTQRRCWRRASGRCGPSWSCRAARKPDLTTHERQRRAAGRRSARCAWVRRWRWCCSHASTPSCATRAR